jgi:hypothetical protein
MCVQADPGESLTLEDVMLQAPHKRTRGVGWSALPKHKKGSAHEEPCRAAQSAGGLHPSSAAPAWSDVRTCMRARGNSRPQIVVHWLSAAARAQKRQLAQHRRRGCSCGWLCACLAGEHGGRLLTRQASILPPSAPRQPTSRLMRSSSHTQYVLQFREIEQLQPSRARRTESPLPGASLA